MKSGTWALLLGLAAATTSSAQSLSSPGTLADYARYELREVTAPKKAHPEAMDKIKAGIKDKLDGAIAQWNQAGAQPGHAGTLVIEIVITELRYVSATKRNWTGNFSGESHAGARVRFIDADSGRTLHGQSFWEEGNGLARQATVGEGPAGDAAMLDRLTSKIGKWVIATHDHTDRLHSTSEQEGKAAAN